MSAAGFVASLQIFPGHRKPMLPLHEVRVLTNKGLEGDMHSLAKSTRQVLLLDEETWDSLQQSTPGIRRSPAATCLRLQTVQPAGGIPSGLRSDLEGRRRILARVVRGGLMRRGEHIELL